MEHSVVILVQRKLELLMINDQKAFANHKFNDRKSMKDITDWYTTQTIDNNNQTTQETVDNQFGIPDHCLNYCDH